MKVARCERLSPDVAKQFSSIYEASFPPAERDDTGQLIASIEAGERSCYLASLDGSVVGLAVIFPLDGVGIAFLEYMAVDETHRDRGIGSAMLVSLHEQLNEARGIVLEAERAQDADGDERRLRERRIAFYVRNGYVEVECAPHYRAPDLEQDDATVAFTLCWRPLADGVPAQLSGDLLRRCVTAILTQSYELDPDDPLVEGVLADLAC